MYDSGSSYFLTSLGSIAAIELVVYAVSTANIPWNDGINHIRWDTRVGHDEPFILELLILI